MLFDHWNSKYFSRFEEKKDNPIFVDSDSGLDKNKKMDLTVRIDSIFNCGPFLTKCFLVFHLSPVIVLDIVGGADFEI